MLVSYITIVGYLVRDVSGVLAIVAILLAHTVVTCSDHTQGH